MATDLVSEFGESLRRLEVTWERTTAEEFPSALDEAIVEPAVGAPLPFDGVSLDGSTAACDPTPRQLREAETGVTPAALGVSCYGTLVLQSNDAGNEPVSLYPPRHVAVLRASDLVPDVGSALEWLGGEFAAGRDTAILATGASATGDMGALVRGVHGPRDVHVIVITDR